MRSRGGEPAAREAWTGAERRSGLGAEDSRKLGEFGLAIDRLGDMRDGALARMSAALSGSGPALALACLDALADGPGAFSEPSRARAAQMLASHWSSLPAGARLDAATEIVLACGDKRWTGRPGPRGLAAPGSAMDWALCAGRLLGEGESRLELPKRAWRALLSQPSNWLWRRAAPGAGSDQALAWAKEGMEGPSGSAGDDWRERSCAMALSLGALPAAISEADPARSLDIASKAASQGFGRKAMEWALGLAAASPELGSLLPGLAVASARAERASLPDRARMPSRGWGPLLARPEWGGADLAQARLALSEAALAARDPQGYRTALPEGPPDAKAESRARAALGEEAFAGMQREWMLRASRLAAGGSPSQGPGAKGARPRL